jgi:hypothetical protein
MSASWRDSGFILAALSAAALLSADAQSPAPRAYVQASRAALRSQPSGTASIVDYLITNTEVEITERAPDWCGVRSDALRGFVACRLLSETKLSIGTIEAKLRDRNLSARDRLDWTSRAFWVSPSLSRFEDVGNVMEPALLTSAARDAEMMRGRAQRPLNGEFEAMKTRLEKGVIASRRPPVPGATTDLPENPVGRAMTRAALPAVRRSYFGEDDLLLVLALRPYSLGNSDGPTTALADALSAEYDAVVRMRVAEPTSFGHDGAHGMWDVGAIEATFSKEVTVHGLSSAGMPTGFSIRSFVMPVGYQPCSGTTSTFKGRPINARWNSAIVGWVGKAPPPAKARLASQRLGGAGEYDKLTIDTVDLDADGVPDFSIWSGIAPAVVSTDSFWKAVFVNVGGAWQLLGSAQEPDCT